MNTTAIQYKKFAKQYHLIAKESEFQAEKIASSFQSQQYARNFYQDDLEIYESFWVIFLARNNTVKGFVRLSQGGLTGTVVDPRLLAKYALESLACGVILVHNHPSGNTRPSEADLDITRKIKSTLNLFDCNVLDHIILGGDNYYSFADEGII